MRSGISGPYLEQHQRAALRVERGGAERVVPHDRAAASGST